MKYGLDSDHVRSQTPSRILCAELRQHVGRLCSGETDWRWTLDIFKL